MGKLYDELESLEKYNSRPIYDPLRRQIRDKMAVDDIMFKGAIQESIEMIENGEFREASILLQDIAAAADDRKGFKGA